MIPSPDQDDDEAIDAIVAEAPDLSDEQLAQLARLLTGHPAAVNDRRDRDA